jgi:CHAD domain-containing protein
MLADPAVGRTLLQITRWIEIDGIQTPQDKHKPKDQPISKWMGKRIAQLADRLDAMPSRSKDPAVQHEMRILAKRLRYGIECLRALLSKRRAERWHRIATRHQTDIGIERDRQQAMLIAQRLQAAEGIVEFMRGAAFAALSPGV